MQPYETKTFSLPELSGISSKQIEVHLGLYAGYVKHVNLIAEKLSAVRTGELSLDPYIVAELRRRFAFEFDGMRMHEYFFAQFEHGHSALTPESALAQLAIAKYGSIDGFTAHIKDVATTRGIGWVVVYHDPHQNVLHTTFVADHEVGQLSGLTILLALDVWEHAFMVDYVPAQKKDYVEAVFANLNWDVCAARLS